MLNYGLEAFYPSPQYQDFCKTEGMGKYPVTAPMKISDINSVNCTFSKTLQEQTDKCYASQGFPIYDYDNSGCTSSIKECNFCNKNFEDARRPHDKTVFIIALIIGIITLLIGYGILSVDPVSSALIASGIGAIFYGSTRNWDNLSDIWRFLLLLLALVFLIWITLKINKKVEKNRK